VSSDYLLYSLIVFLVALAGGIIALIRRWSDAGLHLFISFGAGIFLGTVFLHLLPEAFGHEHVGEASAFVLIGFLGIFLIERFLTLTGDGGYDHSHLVVSITALLGLSVHSVIEGFGLAVGAINESVGETILISVLAHKATAAFSLTSLFILAKMSRARSFWLLTLFACMTPLGTILLGPILAGSGNEIVAALTGLTAGSFLYVSTGELLPEVFHTREHRWWKLLLMTVGIVIMGYLGGGSHHSH
jgi:zinc and cadmium transporter